VTAPTLLRTRATMRRVNDLIWESLDHGGRPEPVAFFCECAQEGCYLPVWLTPVEYEQSRRRPVWLSVSPSHPEAATR
jgi:hypothetical protein